MTRDLVGKYDRIADGFAERSYANLSFYMQRRLVLVTAWGRSLGAGDSVLEVGCGDGYLAQLLVGFGLRYAGVDLSPGMVAAAEHRFHRAGLKASFSVTDISRMQLSEPVDAVVSFMRSFFTYVQDPFTVLKRLRPYVRKKIVVDLEPRRSVRVAAAANLLWRAGYANIRWRPFLVSEKKKLPVSILRTLVACESIPLIRAVPLRWKFHALIKGEVC
jgi:ubiquinone/menaquinone biosynthesis C-methylase UbiE